MSAFLKQVPLSNQALDLYTKSLGMYPLTYQELCSLTPDLTSDGFKDVINQLIDLNLMFKIKSKKPEIITHYIALPPLKYILNFYDNIESNVLSIQKFMGDSLSQIFKENNDGINSLFNQFQEIKNSSYEDIVIQRQGFKEIIEKFEKAKKIKSFLTGLKTALSNIMNVLNLLDERFHVIIQTQFSNLLELLTAIKTKLEIKLKALIVNNLSTIHALDIVEEIFQEELNTIIDEFLSTIKTLIELEIQELKKSVTSIIDDTINTLILEPIDGIVEDIFRFKDEFVLLYQNVLNNFDANMKGIQEILVLKKEDLFDDMKNAESNLINDFKEQFKNSIQQISESWKLKEKVMEQFFNRIIKSDITKVDNIWFVNSRIKLKEEIHKILSESTEQITLIIPNLTNFLDLNEFQKISGTRKVRIASSESHSDEIVNELKKIENLEYRNLKNDNMIAIKGDENRLLFSIIRNDSKNELNNAVGIGSNFKPVIDMTTPIIETSWSVAKPEDIIKVEEEMKREKETRLSIEELMVFISNIKPEKNYGVEVRINERLNAIIQDLNSLTGKEFSEKLQNLSDYILEKIGFSYTLHSISTWINIYKINEKPLDDRDKAQILSEIESWKTKLFNLH